MIGRGATARCKIVLAPSITVLPEAVFRSRALIGVKSPVNIVPGQSGLSSVRADKSAAAYFGSFLKCPARTLQNFAGINHLVDAAPQRLVQGFDIPCDASARQAQRKLLD